MTSWRWAQSENGKDLSGPGKGFSRTIIRRIGTSQNNTLNSFGFLFSGFGIELASSWKTEIRISDFGLN
jgi:hypothetical protein